MILVNHHTLCLGFFWTHSNGGSAWLLNEIPNDLKFECREKRIPNLEPKTRRVDTCWYMLILVKLKRMMTPITPLHKKWSSKKLKYATQQKSISAKKGPILSQRLLGMHAYKSYNIDNNNKISNFWQYWEIENWENICYQRILRGCPSHQNRS